MQKCKSRPFSLSEKELPVVLLGAQCACISSRQEVCLRINVNKHILDDSCFVRHYNIPDACLLNRSPVPAMDLKSNRSGV